MRLRQMKNNRHLSEDQTQYLPLRPDTGGTGRGGKQFKQSSSRYDLRDILWGGRTRNLLCL